MAMSTDSLSNRDKSTGHPYLIALLIFILIAGIGSVLVWVLIEPVIIVSGKIHVAPAVNILTGEREVQILDYQALLNTQAQRITSNSVLRRVADDLAYKNLRFFEESTDLVNLLQQAIADEIITASAISGTGSMAVTVKTHYPDEGVLIVNSFTNNFVNFSHSASAYD